jgi:hypothetical protein
MTAGRRPGKGTAFDNMPFLDSSVRNIYQHGLVVNLLGNGNL